MIWRRLKKSTPKTEEAFARQLDEVKLTGKDRFAMILSAFLVIFVPCVLILGGFGFLILLLFGGL